VTVGGASEAARSVEVAAEIRALKNQEGHYKGKGIKGSDDERIIRKAVRRSIDIIMERLQHKNLQQAARPTGNAFSHYYGTTWAPIVLVRVGRMRRLTQIIDDSKSATLAYITTVVDIKSKVT